MCRFLPTPVDDPSTFKYEKFRKKYIYLGNRPFTPNRENCLWTSEYTQFPQPIKKKNRNKTLQSNEKESRDVKRQWYH